MTHQVSGKTANVCNFYYHPRRESAVHDVFFEAVLCHMKSMAEISRLPEN
jgi:hypothetical protein